LPQFRAQGVQTRARSRVAHFFLDLSRAAQFQQRIAPRLVRRVARAQVLFFEKLTVRIDLARQILLGLPLVREVKP